MEDIQLAVPDPSSQAECNLPAHIVQLKAQLLQATTDPAGPTAVQQAMPLSAVKQVLQCAAALCKGEPTCLEIAVQEPCQVVVVGDTHGQFHDVCAMLEKFGYPSGQRLYIFNGDYVDRGSWGYELMLLLLTLKMEYPTRCFLLRGNHESTTCTTWYGFKAEVAAKWGKDGPAVYAAFKKLFSVLPLAAVVNQTTLILHGGLFRSAPPPKFGKANAKNKKRKVVAPSGVPGAEPVLELGTLQVLRGASKGGTDPDGHGNNVVAADVLWSDPGPEPGLRLNEVRGVGLVFGPDVTQEFLTTNNLKLVIRSHEGPDARERRGDLPQVLSGWSLDHDTPAGQLMTLFSAPDYPQFMAPEEKRYNNQGAVAVLSGPTWSTPQLLSFDAVQPRPEAVAYYDYLVYADTDEDPVGSSLNGSEAGSDMGGESVRGDDADMEGEEDEVASGQCVGQEGKQQPVGVQPSLAQPAALLPVDTVLMAQAHVQSILSTAQQLQHGAALGNGESQSAAEGPAHEGTISRGPAGGGIMQPSLMAAHAAAGSDLHPVAILGLDAVQASSAVHSPAPSPTKSARAIRDHVVLAAMRGIRTEASQSPRNSPPPSTVTVTAHARSSKRRSGQAVQQKEVDSGLARSNSNQVVPVATELSGSMTASGPEAHSLGSPDGPQQPVLGVC